MMALAAVLVQALYAQGPTTKWPYVYPEFRTGVVEMTDGVSQTYQINVHLGQGQLHFLDAEGLIREAPGDKILGAQVGADRFLQVQGEMMRVVAQSAHGYVVEEALADFAALSETGGAYGSSSQTSATRMLSSVEMPNQVMQNHLVLMQSKSDGRMLDVLKSYYLVCPGQAVKADRRAVEGILPEERLPEWKVWTRAHKIRWKQPESLVSVLEFLNP